MFRLVSLKIKFNVVFLIALLALSQTANAKNVDYELVIDESVLSPAGEERQALTLNGAIPGPTLRFKVGDVARIKVTNNLDEDSSIHWHGLLVPNEQDGVPYLTTPPIKAKTSHQFEFPLTHAGTYWYHSHTGLQEQRGVYGSIVVEPQDGEPVKVDKDVVVLLSDWTNEHPHEVMRTLMRGSEYYSLKKGNMQSLWGAWRRDLLYEYFDREWSRMPPMDISDVAYDAFLVNGKTRSEIDAKPGDRVRLRIINAAASTYFYLNSATENMTIVAADGPAVMPVKVKRILIGMAETYDVIITLPKTGSYEFRATAQDGSGYASVFIGKGEEIKTSSPPKANLYSMDEMLEAALELSDTPNEDRPMAPYKKLRSRTKTTLPAGKELREVTLRLTGNMARYEWSFNDKTLGMNSKIPVKKGEILRLKLINDTMMHHPLHLHGHFFRLVNGQGDFAPLKHTVDVRPMGRQTIEFFANESGDWFFHCHLLYHMDAGMARVLSYEADEDYEPSLDPNLINPWFLFVGSSIQSHMSEGSARLMFGASTLSLGWMSTLSVDWEIGFNEYDPAFEIDEHEGFEYEVDFTSRHFISLNWSVFAGFRLANEEDTKNRGILGATYRLPSFVFITVTVDTEFDVRVTLEKEFQLTERLSLFVEAQYDTNTRVELSTGFIFTINKNLALVSQFHSDYGFGGGIMLYL